MAGSVKVSKSCAVAARLAAILFALLCPSVAAAHGGADIEPGWTFDLWLTAPLAATAWLAGVGVARRWLFSRAQRRTLAAEGGWFALAWLTLAATVLSPLHEAGERSFTAHMIEHELLMMIVAPLFVLARPLPTLMWGLAPLWRRGLGQAAARAWVRLRPLVRPMTATALQATALWLWHAPVLFELALTNEFWHAAQHISFFVTALLFWAAMFNAQNDIGVRVLCLFATSIVSGALGAMMAFSASPWYAPYAALGMTPFGLSPAEDQQLAGTLMWAPGGLVHAAAALALLAPFLSSRRDAPGGA